MPVMCHALKLTLYLDYLISSHHSPVIEVIPILILQTRKLKLREIWKFAKSLSRLACIFGACRSSPGAPFKLCVPRSQRMGRSHTGQSAPGTGYASLGPWHIPVPLPRGLSTADTDPAWLAQPL